MSVRIKSGSWRRGMVERMRARDGARCCACGEAERPVYRYGGYGCGERWGDDPWETHRFSYVNRCSNLELEHALPLSAGGTNDADNLQLMCGPCHKVKTSAERSARLKALFAEARAA